MPIRIIKLCLLILLIAAAIYFVTINNAMTTLTVGGDNTVTASSGTIVLTSFALGILLAFLTASIFAVKSFFREQGFKHREKQRVDLQSNMLLLKESERNDTGAAVDRAYKKLLQKFPGEILVYLEYIRFLLYRDNRPVEALKVITECKGLSSTGELLYLSAEAHEKLGNTSSALEALSLLLGSSSPPALLRKAAEYSFILRRYEDTIEYIRKIKDTSQLTNRDLQLHGDALSSVIIRDELDEEIRLRKLVETVRKHDQTVIGLTEIARLQKQYRLYTEAAESLMRLYKLTGDGAAVNAARALWIEQGNGEAAVAATKQLLRSAKTWSEKVTAKIELAKTYLLLSQDDDALTVLEETYSQGADQISMDEKKEISILKAMIMFRKKDAVGAQGAFAEVEKLTLTRNLDSTHRNRITNSAIS